MYIRWSWETITRSGTNIAERAGIFSENLVAARVFAHHLETARGVIEVAAGYRADKLSFQEPNETSTAKTAEVLVGGSTRNT